jgi:hypothetical protein
MKRLLQKRDDIVFHARLSYFFVFNPNFPLQLNCKSQQNQRIILMAPIGEFLYGSDS